MTVQRIMQKITQSVAGWADDLKLEINSVRAIE